MDSMTNNHAHRNLLILLARHHASSLDKAKVLRENAALEEQPGRKSGLYCHANVITKGARKLKELLHEDRGSLEQLFGTTNLSTIAQQQFTLSK